MAQRTFANQIDNVSPRASFMVDYLFVDDTGEYISDRTGLEMVDFDKGDMIWIEYIEVVGTYRKQGVARKMLHELHKEVQEAVDSCFIITYSMRGIPEPEVYRFDAQGGHEEYAQLLGALGFRRARGSPFFVRVPQFDAIS